jgi:hypothetical protein
MGNRKDQIVNSIRLLLTLVAFVLATSVPDFSSAQTEEALTLKEDPNGQKKEDDGLKFGWTPQLKFSANLSFGTSSDVIGQQNGDSITVGGKIEGGYFFRDELNEWRNNLTYAGATSSTPAIPRYVKSMDLLEVNSIFLRSLPSRKWLGPYAQVNLQAPLFKGEDVRSSAETYTLNGTAVQTGDVMHLTDAFRPLRTKESLGFFARIFDQETLKATARLGLGAIQVKADGQLAIDDDASTPNIELRTLDSYSHTGIEAGLDISGKLDDKTSYSLVSEILIPFSIDEPEAQGRDEIELADVSIKGSLMTKVYEWMSLNYEISFIKQPLLQERYQTTSLLTLNFTHQLL